MNDFFVCFTNDAILKITVDGAVGGKGEDWLDQDFGRLSSNHVVAPVAQLQLNLVIHRVMSFCRYLLLPS